MVTFSLPVRVETESKVGYTVDSGRPAREATMDINRLAANRTARVAWAIMTHGGTYRTPPAAAA